MAAPEYGAGSLRYRMTFAERDSTEDEYGNASSGWVDRFTVSANITAKVGGEAVDAARLTGRQPVILTVRRSADTRAITTDWKATELESGREFNIRTAIDPFIGDSGHGLWIEMLAEAGVAV
jgi:head-tail adaptor